ncbi:serine/threonine-protein kinase PknH/PknJ [Mycobacterium kubicae]|uniref:serine/threonine-protein kinase PknH/PknJ n=1 Tax=Mycobacterium kubicae TaxID=120959 RepID=UPI001F6151B0|nr:serine/threonine-protein kinase PknH/PknJ [Mycobacterium kubicae]
MPFGRYRLIELLGRGGMGEVWRAHDRVVDRTVAIKMLLAHFAQDRTFEQRFRREARAAASLDDPHVVPIYDVGEIDGRLYVAMRLIRGEDLQTILDSGQLEPGRAVGIIEQIASALQSAHKAGLVHRDVKPSNILVTEEDFAYLIDFGIARAAGDTGITSTGATIGTWSYMAPERFKSGEIEPSSDIYALACVLYQMLSGQLPFPGTTLEQVAMAHMTASPPKPSAQRRALPTAMDDVIAIGLAKDPRQRYRTAKELAQAAREALTAREQARSETIMADTQEARARPAPVGSPDPKADQAPFRNDAGSRTTGTSRLVAVIAAFVALVLIAALIVVWRPWGRTSVLRSTDSLRPTSTSVVVPAQQPASPTAQPPAPGVSSPATATGFPATNIGSVLLPPEAVSRVVGAANLQIKSTQGMSDNSGLVTPFACVGVVFGADRKVYGNTGFDAILDQTLTPGNYSYNSTGPTEVEQTAVVFPSAQKAQEVLASSQVQWQACAAGKVGYRVPGTNGEVGWDFDMGSVRLQDDILTVSMAGINHESGDSACQQALGIRANVIVGARTCLVPDIPVTATVADPNLAGQYAQKLASEILSSIHF